jgi:hypothetical protein
VTAAHIEHFRPKGIPAFAELIFRWDNLFLACPSCNTGNKGTQFPLDDRGQALLVDPCREEPQDFLHFDVVSGRIVGRNDKGKVTVQVLGLNRTDLWERRNTLVEQLKRVAQIAASGNAQALEILQEAAEDASEYSAFAKKLITTIRSLG